MTPAARRQHAVTLALSVALAFAVGVSAYFAATSVPFLALSPTSDPLFGKLNDCALNRVQERLGFAVRADLGAVAVFGRQAVVVCEVDAAPAEVALPGVTHAAFARDGTLWLSTTERLQAWQHGELSKGTLVRAQALAPLGDGVALVDHRGQLVLVGPTGVTAAVDLDTALEPTLSSSDDLGRLAVQLGPRVLVVDALGAVTFDQVPCDTAHHVWLAGHELLVACDTPPTWALAIDVDSGAQRPANQWPAAGVRRVGGRWIERCDVLPCTAAESTP